MSCEKCKERETTDRISELENKVKELEGRLSVQQIFQQVCTLPHYCTRRHYPEPQWTQPWQPYYTVWGSSGSGNSIQGQAISGQMSVTDGVTF